MQREKWGISILAVFFLTLLLLPLSAGVVNAEEEVLITNMTASIGGGAYTLTSAMADLAKKHHPWLRISAMETPGYIYNLKAFSKSEAKWKNTILSTNPAVLYLASKGMAPFDKVYDVKDIKFLGNYNTLTRWLITLNKDIKTPQDLIGKKIGLGFAASVDWAVAPNYLFEYGWGIKDKLNLMYMGTNPAISALLDGTVGVAQIDAYMNPFTKQVVGGAPTVEIIASGKKVYHIPWGKDCVVKTKRESGYPISPITIPKGSFQGWLDQDIDTWVGINGYAVKSVFPERIAYELVKLNLKYIDKFKEYHKMGELLSPEVMCYDLTKKDLHPGAIRAYEEAGIKIPEE